ncbi:MAG: DsbA family oxidoreductase [Gemmatimonadota bacterium]
MSAPTAEERKITVFADYVCPFSYLSLLGLDRVAQDVRIQPDWRAFELRPPQAPALAPFPDEEWQLVSELASEAGAELVRPSLRPRTRKAHEAVKHAATLGQADALRHAIFAAYFQDGRDIGRIDVLVEIGASIGIDRGDLKVALDVDAHAEDVVADEGLAHKLEIEGTPAFVAGADVRVGYLSADHLRDWLKD